MSAHVTRKHNYFTDVGFVECKSGACTFTYENAVIFIAVPNWINSYIMIYLQAGFKFHSSANYNTFIKIRFHNMNSVVPVCASAVDKKVLQLKLKINSYRYKMFSFCRVDIIRVWVLCNYIRNKNCIRINPSISLEISFML